MENSEYAATCYFVNVGQGTAQLIHLREHRAIIIDTGRKRKRNMSPLFLLLKELDIRSIEALVLSHNDSDHIGDAKNIFDIFRKRIRHVFFLDDRHLNENGTYKNIKAAIGDGSINESQVMRLEAGINSDIFIDKDNDIHLTVLYPDFLTNMESKKNDTCAIIALYVGSQKIIFSGDVPVEAWKQILQNNGKLAVQILTVPHHGGIFTDNKEDTKWFFENVRTDYAVVSVGYGNIYKHPKEDIIRSFILYGAEVFCTQSNVICNYGLSNINETCCGTIIANVGSVKTDIKNIERLRQIKEQFPQRICKTYC
ncbi:MAG: MBL fold metallo-hydrolase [Planctomycetaceae bacterium]|jgi:competence protein ComEC|nr:MBL fold metallo-hydrolase [Planctomycetaceae bacterium]